MRTFRVNIGPFDAGTGFFRGYGKIREHGARMNPAARIGKRGKHIVLAARLFVGLSVHEKPKWSVKDVVDVVRDVREAQTGDPSASFLSQRGIYKHQSGNRIIDEKSVQVIVLDRAGVGRKKFEKQIIQLGEELARRLKQETVVGELQVNGVTKDAWFITA